MISTDRLFEAYEASKNFEDFLDKFSLFVDTGLKVLELKNLYDEIHKSYTCIPENYNDILIDQITDMKLRDNILSIKYFRESDDLDDFLRRCEPKNEDESTILSEVYHYYLDLNLSLYLMHILKNEN